MPDYTGGTLFLILLVILSEIINLLNANFAFFLGTLFDILSSIAIFFLPCYMLWAHLAELTEFMSSAGSLCLLKNVTCYWWWLTAALLDVAA